MKKAILILVLLVGLVFTSQVYANERDFNIQLDYDNPLMVSGPSSPYPTRDLDESFEDVTFPPVDWVKYSPDGGTGWERITVGTTPIPGWVGGIVTPTPDGLGGSAMAFCTWTTGGAVANDQWLVSKQTSVNSGDSLSFWMRKFSDLYSDYIEILVSTTDNLMASFTNTLFSITYAAADTGWVKYTESLDGYAGQDIYIAWREAVDDNYNDGAALFLDLVEIIEAPVSIDDPLICIDFNIAPNPFNQTTTFSFSLKEAAHVSVDVYNIKGQLVKNLSNEDMLADIHSVSWNGTDNYGSEVPTGVYFTRIVTDDVENIHKVMVIR
ncbi:MAG: choice-of-anchor J domain-containing protein [Candidatus Cloacimonetes bacterium]|nr:choice-of-anchor J domain-containing protein [Candidatus Cloacimonadota bacterium]